MVYVGLDVHKEFSRIGLFEPSTGELRDVGDVTREELRGRVSEIRGPKTVVLESGRTCHYTAALLESVAEEVWIVDAAEVRALQRRAAKTDRRDAAALAFWAAKGALRPIWRPSRETLDLRELTRGKTSLTRLAVRVRNQIRSLLARHGYECPHTDLLGIRAQAWLKEVKIEGYGGQMLASYLELLPVLQGKADEWEKELEREAKAYPAARRLMTIPGVGPVIGLSLAAEIGEIGRFETSTQLRGYSGLDPSVDQSGGSCVYGKITKRGNRWLRYAAGLAAQKVATTRHADPKLKRTYLATAFRHGANPAKVATARRLLDLVHHLLSHEEDYQPPKRGQNRR